MSTKTYAKLELSLGLLNLSLDAAPIRKANLDEASKTSFCCPDPAHKTLVSVTQTYICDDGHRHREHELGRMRIVDDDTKVALDRDEVTAVRCGSAPKQIMTLAIHPAAEVEAATLPNGIAYRLRPGAKSSEATGKAYAILVELAADTTKAIVASARVRDSLYFFRLVLHRGQLTAIALVHPNDLAETDEITTPAVTKANVAMAKQLVKEMTTPFDPDVYYHDVDAAMAALVETKQANAPAPTKTPAKPEIDFMAALEQSLKQRQATTKKATPRKAAAKRHPARKAS